MILSRKQASAAYLMGMTVKSTQEIAKLVGVTANTMRKWRMHPEFIEAVDAAQLQALDDLKYLPYARKADRIRDISTRLGELDAVMEMRAAQADRIDPNREQGVDTGLVVRKKRVVGREVWYEFEVDYALIRERLRLLDEMGVLVGDGPSAEVAPIVVTFTERSDGPR